MAEHVWVHGEGKLAPFSYPREHLAEPGRGRLPSGLGNHVLVALDHNHGGFPVASELTVRTATTTIEVDF